METTVYDFTIREANELITWATLKYRKTDENGDVYESETKTQFGFGSIISGDEDEELSVEELNEICHEDTDAFIDFIFETICRRYIFGRWEPCTEDDIWENLF